MSFREGKAGRRSDSVWWHFSKRWTDEKHYVVICNHCKQRVSAKVDRLRRHLRKCIPGYESPKPDLEGSEGPVPASMSCNDPSEYAMPQPNIEDTSSHLSPSWKTENVLVDSKDSPHSPSAMANQQYCLKWNNHQSNLLRAFDRLLQSESFTDVTLACEGRSLRAHKVVLSACSSYFEQLFEEHPDKSPIIILKDMKFAHVSQLVNFMYRGEINITQDMLSGLLKTAETLKVKGLAEVSGDQPVQAVNPMPPVLRLAASLPQMVAPSNSPLTTALNAPLVAPPTLAPLAALLNPDVNKPGRNSGPGQKERSIWEESRAQELIQRVLSKELSLTAAAVRLGVDTNTFFAHITDNGKNKSRVALLLGTDANTENNSFMNANHSEDSDHNNSAGDPLEMPPGDPLGEDSNPPPYPGSSEDGNMEGVMENSHAGPEMNGDDNEEPEIIEDTADQSRSGDEQGMPEQVTAMQEMTEGDEAADQGVGEPQDAGETVESFQSIVEDDPGENECDAAVANN